jgi:SYP5 family syntaxin
MNRRKDMLTNLRSKVNEMASKLNMSNFANKDSLLGPEVKPDVLSRTVGLDNNGLVGFQRQIIKGYLNRLFENISLGVCTFDLITQYFFPSRTR